MCAFMYLLNVCKCFKKKKKNCREHAIHNATFTVCLPTQDTSLPLPPPPSLLCSLHFIRNKESPYFFQDSTTIAFNLGFWQTRIAVKLQIFRVPLMGFYIPRSSSPASLSRRTSRGSCWLGSSCAASSVRPGTSPDSLLCSYVPSGISSRRPTSGNNKCTNTELDL